MWESVSDLIRWADDSDISNRTNSYLRFQNFDVMATREYAQLKGFQPYEDFSDTYGRGPLDGYRVLTFEYRDFMDDDVAYYNTWGSYMGGRNKDWSDLLDAAAEATEVDVDTLAPWNPGHTEG